MSYLPLATTTLSSAASSVTFSSIPTSVNGVALRDLIIVSEMRTASSTASAYLRFNGATSGYSSVLMRGNGSDAISSNLGGTSDRLYLAYSTEPTTTNASNSITQIMDYSATDKHKTTLVRSNNAADATEAMTGRYASTTAVTSIEIGLDGSLSFASGSTFSLYGVA